MGLLRRERPGDDGDRWIVVGLGNPEAEYGGTRHNIGADVVRALARRLGAPLKAHKAGALVADAFARPGGTPLSLVVPFGYMNESGGPVQRVLQFYKAPPERLVVVHDELDLPPLQLRLKRGGGAAGHNGLRDVQRRIGTPEFLRVRFGIGRPPGRQDPADFVLRPFPARERPDVDVVVEEACDAVLLLVHEGLEAAQNRVHASR